MYQITYLYKHSSEQENKSRTCTDYYIINEQDKWFNIILREPVNKVVYWIECNNERKRTKLYHD